MWSYFIELAIFGLFILLAYRFKICKKNSKKDIVRSIIVAIAILFFNILVDFIFNIILLFIYDIPSAYVTFAFLMDFVDILIPAAGVYVISMLLGCNRKVGIIVAISAIVVLVSLALSYVEIDAVKVPEDTLQTVEEIADDALRLCNKLESITVDSGNTNFVVSNNALYTFNKEKLIAYPAACKEKEFTISPNTTPKAIETLISVTLLLFLLYSPNKLPNTINNPTKNVTIASNVTDK